MFYEFTELELHKEEFDNLVFMGNPPWWTDIKEYPSGWDRTKYPFLPMPEGQEFLNSLCYKPLKKVAEAVIEKSGLTGLNSTATKVFENIDIKARGETEPWFSSHTDLSKRFSTSLMPRIWIRNLARHEREAQPTGTFYTEDGNHRALIYAVLVECKEVIYEPFKALHATSWNFGVLEHSVIEADHLEDKGILQYDPGLFVRVSIDKSSLPFTLPFGIQVQESKRQCKL